MIADLVRAGLAPELIARVSNALVAAASGGNRVDKSAARRREWDREYRRRKRENPPDIHPNPPESTRTLHIESSSLSSDSEVQERKEGKILCETRLSGGRGTRIPNEWFPSPEGMTFARQTLGHTKAQGELEKFRDYWAAKSGAGGVKRDWDATWRNWVRNSADRVRPQSPDRGTIFDVQKELRQ